MMSALDALRYKLTPPGSTGLEGEQLNPAISEMLGPGPGRRLPPGLPLVVQDSILKRPSYQEGGQYAPRDFGGEQNLPEDDPRNREYRLNDLLDFNEYMRRNSQHAWPEDYFSTPLQPGQSPYATPEAPSPGLDTLPGGATRISAGQGLLQPQGMPSPEMLAALAAQQRAWEARQPQGYAEGQIMAPEPWWNEALGGQLQKLGPQREERLQFDRRQALGLDNPETENPWLQAMPEGGVWSSRPPDVSPFSSPLNQMLRRPPFGQY